MALAPIAVRPINLPRIVALIGKNTKELADALSALDPDIVPLAIHNLGEEILADYIVPAIELNEEEQFKFARSLDYFLQGTLGGNYASRLIYLDDSDQVIIYDATTYDLEELSIRFPQLLVIVCGPLTWAQEGVKTIWLAHEDVNERMAQLRRELGEL